MTLQQQYDALDADLRCLADAYKGYIKTKTSKKQPREPKKWPRPQGRGPKGTYWDYEFWANFNPLKDTSKHHLQTSVLVTRQAGAYKEID